MSGAPLDLQHSESARFSHRFAIQKVLLLSLALTAVTACSIYKSDGRGQFENAAPAKLQSQSVKDTTLEDLSDSQRECWIQPSNEPLWHADGSHVSGQRFVIKSISSQIFQVCEVAL
jgi:hypothetical protein